VSPLLICLLALALASPLFWIVRPHRFRHIGWLAALVPAGVTAWLLIQLPTIAAGNTITTTVPWSPQLGLELALRVDGLGAFFGLIITGIGAAIALYTGYYFENEPRLGYFYGLLFLFMASMLGIVWVDNLLLLYAFWEGTSITSYLLIAFKDSDNDAQAGARRAFLVTALGSLAMLMGFILLSIEARTYTISQIVQMPELAQSAIAPAAICLILLGAFTKSAQFPFHFWLPGAMAAPTPASAYLHSATMVKAGVYLLARLHPALSDHPIWFWSLLIAGMITMVSAALIAIGKSDIKALLAYATVSQLGGFVLLLAFDASAAHIALIVGILAHALYKGALFMVAGIVDHATGTRDLRRLANLRKEMPLTSVVAFFALMSMAGVIPMFGFLAKELVLESFILYSETNAVLGWIGVIMAVVSAAFTVGASLILLWEAFVRPHADVEEGAHVHHRPSVMIVLPPALLTVVALSIPFLLVSIEGLIFAPAIRSVSATEVDVHLALWHGLNLTFTMSLLALALGGVVFALRAPMRRILLSEAFARDAAVTWEALINQLYNVANWVTRNVQGTTLLQQARGILIAAVVAMVVALSAVNWPEDFPINWEVQPHIPETITATLTIFAAIITAIARTRLGAIISLGVVGMAITLFFVFNSAPDLAITQLLVDILTVVLLILVFYRIPPSSYVRAPKKIGMRNVILSVFVGFLGFFFVLFTVSEPFFPVIGDYFLYNAVPLGHGANVVNVILVDFRGFDTYGEITVLGIAAVGGYAVLRAGLFRFRPPAPVNEIMGEVVEPGTDTGKEAAISGD
jgi:multicomponent Na+:H+ antiporter subunit A